MAVHLRESMVGGQDGGAMPRLLFIEMPTPRATRIRPRVDMLYLLRIDFICKCKDSKKTAKVMVGRKWLKHN
jgi:hypothetical protein